MAARAAEGSGAVADEVGRSEATVSEAEGNAVGVNGAKVVVNASVAPAQVAASAGASTAAVALAMGSGARHRRKTKKKIKEWES